MFHDQQNLIVGELYSNLFIPQEKVLNCFDSQIDSSQIVDTLNIILDVSNSHGRDNFQCSKPLLKYANFFGYKEILHPFFQSSLVEQHSSEISQLELVEDIKQDNLNKVEYFIHCSLIALSHGVLRIEDTHLQSFLFEQHEGIILHEFHDPVASWMELYFF